MNILLNIPYIARVLVSLLIILVIHKLSKKLWLSVLIGTLLLAFWTGHSLNSIISISWARAASVNNILLIVLVCQIISLSLQMSATNTMKEMVNQVRAGVSQRTSMALLPAIIGLLPMPGGAIFSAPLVDDCDRKKQLMPILKTRINFWFRHIWEYWWPLYPGVLLAVDITGLPISTFMLIQFPLSIFSILAGYIFLLRKVHPSGDKRDPRKFSFKKFFSLIAPIIIIISIYAIIKLFFPVISKTNKYIPMIIGILLAQLFLQIRKPLSLQSWKKIIFSKKTFILMIIVVLIRIYGAFIEARLPDGSLLMAHMRGELNSWGFPIILIIMLLPFISGMTTGLAIGFVGASFPVIMSLLGKDPGINKILATTVLAYTCGYAGMLLSPVHICLIVTNEYFKTSLMESILRLIKPVLFVIAAGIIMYLLIR